MDALSWLNFWIFFPAAPLIWRCNAIPDAEGSTASPSEINCFV
jgi:hypothetical protein